MIIKSGFYCVVTGKVQGVWFRASTKTQAEALGLTGWAKNLPDGRVEVTAYGEDDKLEALYQWLHQGPPLAKVSDVSYQQVEWQAFTGFKIL